MTDQTANLKLAREARDALDEALKLPIGIQITLLELIARTKAPALCDAIEAQAAEIERLRAVLEAAEDLILSSPSLNAAIVAARKLIPKQPLE